MPNRTVNPYSNPETVDAMTDERDPVAGPYVSQAADQHGHAPVPALTSRRREPPSALDPVIDVADLSVFYGSYEAVRDVSFGIGYRQITALIGPSGCGKSTVLRCFNRMNDLIAGARVTGKI